MTLNGRFTHRAISAVAELLVDFSNGALGPSISKNSSNYETVSWGELTSQNRPTITAVNSAGKHFVLQKYNGQTSTVSYTTITLSRH